VVGETPPLDCNLPQHLALSFILSLRGKLVAKASGSSTVIRSEHGHRSGGTDLALIERYLAWVARHIAALASPSAGAAAVTSVPVQK
jgi:hypothetical protein